MDSILIDSGPLTALVAADSPNHPAAVEAVKRARGRIVTIWPVVTEACYFLGPLADALLVQVEEGIIQLAPLGAEDIPRIVEIRSLFSDRPLDLADAALVRVMERDGVGTLMTLDERDFRPIERAFKGRFRLVVPKAR